MGKSRQWIQRFFFRFGEKRTIHRVPVAVWMLSNQAEKRLAFKRIEAALGIIERHAPQKLNALQSDVRSILVSGDRTMLGRYLPSLGMVELDDKYVREDETTSEALACTLIHEAQHARLMRLGFGYEEPIRGRIEKICIRAERNFAKLLPNGSHLIDQAEAWINADLDSYFSNENRRQRDLKTLEDLGAPAWLIKTVSWIARRRAT